MSEETITYNIQVDTSLATKSLSELNRLLTTYVALTRRMGLPPKIDEFIRMTLRGKVAVESLIRSIQLFYASTGPLGWAIALGGMALSGLMLVDTFEYRSPEY